MFWRIKFSKIALIHQIHQTLVLPTFHRLRYGITYYSSHRNVLQPVLQTCMLNCLGHNGHIAIYKGKLKNLEMRNETE